MILTAARTRGLEGFPDPIAAECPDAKIQLCIVHNSLLFAPWKQYKTITADSKLNYQTTYAIRSLDTVVRKATRKRKVVPNRRVSLQDRLPRNPKSLTKWATPIRNWKLTPKRFSIAF